MIGEPSQPNTQESNNLNSEQLERGLTEFIKEQNYSANDIEQAFLIANGDDSVGDENIMRLAEKMKELLNGGMSLNKIGKIIADMKGLEMREDDYMKKLYLFKFDNESMKILQQLPNMKSGGTCIVKIGGQPKYNFEIPSEVDPQEVKGVVLQLLDNLGDAGRQFPLQVEFHESH